MKLSVTVTANMYEKKTKMNTSTAGNYSNLFFFSFFFAFE